MGGYLVDMLVALVMYAPGWLVLGLGPSETVLCTDLEGRSYLCEEPTSATALLGLLLMLAAFIGFLVYYAKLTASPSGQTLGKRAAGIRVIDANTGGQVSTAKAVGRWFAQILSALPFYLGYLWPIWDRRGQAFHDKIAATLVVPVARYPVRPQSPGPTEPVSPISD